ncbi:intermembrane phospholipid transport protein YdbH family protein [Ectopseudomonas alcaliphila]|uniref:Dicarboxylate transport n=1 Tax=Ectopseudomonas alcaliphila TaxID=101564 RepID=A0A1G7Q6Q4_9GAMM|nr:YdbH domain-containing protein [Pseudomonas alcaliphila]MDX5994562.1 YdbH domain-containing protein [Pseudomonas alcaliphila]SDF94135.1 Dicarboxylate transport [Pseudomonas alcaliphila]
MSRRRFWLSICVAILALLSLLACYVGYRVQQLLDEQHIELDWQRLSLSWRGLQLQDASLVQRRGGELQVQSGALQLYWLASEAPRYRLVAQDLRLSWQPAQAESEGASDSDLAGLLKTLSNTLPWLPRRIELYDVHAQLPCSSGRCTLQGDIDLRLLDDTLQLHTQLLRAAHRAQLQVQLLGLGSELNSPRQLQMNLHLDDQPQIALHSDLQAQADALQWSGELEITALQDMAWLAEWLSEWTLLDAAALPATPQQAGMNAQWQLQVPQAPPTVSELLATSGWLRVDAQLPQPWPLPGVGLVSGELALDLRNTLGGWQARRLNGHLQLDTRDAPWLTSLPSGLRPQRLQLHLAPLDGDANEVLGLQLNLSGQGPLELQADAELGLRQSPDWALEVRHLQLEARSKRLDLAGSRLDDLRLNLDLAGSVTEQQVQLTLADRSRLEVQRLRSAELDLQQAQATLAGISLSGAPGAPTLSGPLGLRTQRLHHPQLQAQGWQWQGSVNADAGSQILDGALLADSGLSMALRANNTSNSLNLNATLDELFLRAGNPLAQTLANWPPLMTLENGRIQGNASLNLPSGKPLQLKASLTGKGLAGIYDRSTLSGLDAELRLQLSGDRLRLDLPQLSAKQLDPGIELGPLQLQASYQASLQRPLAGSLTHQRAELGILGGSLSLAPATWSLEQPSQLLQLRLNGLNLQELFRVYPAEGLAGSGLIDGTLPLRLGGAISIEQGLIEARPPGGQLRFHSPRIRAMGQTNPGMKLVTDALEDFHYDLLSSSVDYDQSGTLRLGMRLHGQNPAIEKGRPIHFNINLEEDIPALLASLQLTDKVSGIIQQRIQQWMRQRVPQEPKE